MARNSSVFTTNDKKVKRKKTRQGMGQGTKFNSNFRSKRHKKKYRGQGK